MMPISMRATIAYSAALSAAVPAIAPAMAQSAPDLADLVGARAAGGETQMESRGYRTTGGSTVRDMKFTFWWNGRKHACVSISTVDGRYASIQAVPAGNCDTGSRSPSALSAYQDRPPVQDDAGSLVLVCYGAGTKPTVTSRPDYNWNADTKKWEWSSSLQNTAKGFSSDVQLELYGDHGRIHLGQSLVPPIHSGGSDGWWDLDNLSVTPGQITASYRLNGLNKPRLTIDRQSGRIDIKAVTNFSGRCDIGDYAEGKRRF